MAKAIIFGISGQDGYYLHKLLLGQGIEVIGVSRQNRNYTIGEISDRFFVENLIRKHQPDFIFHFAANSTTNHQAIFDNYDAISTGTLSILESVYNHSPKTKIFLSGSGLQFVNTGHPIIETDPFTSNSSYALTRNQSILTARYYRSLGLSIYIGYLFNHDSPLRTERHVNQKIIQAFKRVANGSNEKLALLNINSRKEFGFAGDIVNAIWALISNETIFEAVIGTGIDYSIEDWLNICENYFSLSWKKIITFDNSDEYKILVSDPSTIKSMGWEPQINIENLAKIMIESELN